MFLHGEYKKFGVVFAVLYISDGTCMLYFS